MTPCSFRPEPRTDGRSLFEQIGDVSFAMDDLRLFLDTHPNCAEALSLFNEYKRLRHELIARYTEACGSLVSYYPDSENGWTWNDGPMPWQTEVKG